MNQVATNQLKGWLNSTYKVSLSIKGAGNLCVDKAGRFSERYSDRVV